MMNRCLGFFSVFKLTDKRLDDVLNAHYTTPAAEGLNLCKYCYRNHDDLIFSPFLRPVYSCGDLGVGEG